MSAHAFAVLDSRVADGPDSDGSWEHLFNNRTMGLIEALSYFTTSRPARPESALAVILPERPPRCLRADAHPAPARLLRSR